MSRARLRLRTAAIDLERRLVRRGRSTIQLTPLEAALLGYLADRPGQVVSREQLLSDVWGYAPGVSSRTVDTTMYSLRKKVERRRGEPQHLVSVRGVGFRFEPLAIPDGHLGAAVQPTMPPIPHRTIGRDELVAEILDGTHVTVLRGPPGVGKTRLAIATGAIWSSLRRPRTTVYANLIGVADPGHLCSIVVRALNTAVAPQPPDRQIEAVGQILREHRGLLLILDHAEHVGLANAIDRWTHLAPATTILIASAVPLDDLSGDRILSVPPLSPRDGARLLEDRCRRAVAPDERPVLEALSAALDGLPAALLPAAGLLTTHRASVALEQVSKLLPQASTGLARIWPQLSTDQRSVATQLAAIPGPFTPALAEEVVDPEREVDVLRILAELVDLSLLTMVTDGAIRFSMLEVVRAYARDQDEHPGRTFARVSCAVGSLGKRLYEKKADDPVDLTLLLAVARTPGPGQVGATLGARRIVSRHGPMELVGELFDALTPSRDDEEGDVWFEKGLRKIQQGRYGDALPWLERSPRGDHPRAWRTERMRSLALLYMGQFDAAATAIANAERLAARSSEARARGMVAVTHGDVLMIQGEPERALECFSDGVTELRRIDDWTELVPALRRYGQALRHTGRLAESLDVLQEALGHLPAGEESVDMALCRSLLGSTLRALGRARDALPHMHVSLTFLRRYGSPNLTMVAALNLGWVQLDLLDWDAAALALQEALTLQATTEYRSDRLQIHAGLAMVALALGRLEEAQERWELLLDVRDVDLSGLAHAGLATTLAAMRSPTASQVAQSATSLPHPWPTCVASCTDVVGGLATAGDVAALTEHLRAQERQRPYVGAAQIMLCAADGLTRRGTRTPS